MFKLFYRATLYNLIIENINELVALDTFLFFITKNKIKTNFFLENNYCKYGEVAFANGYKKKDINPQIIIHFLRNSSSPSNGNLREHHACGFNEHIIYFFDSQRSFRTRKKFEGYPNPSLCH